VDGRGGGSEFWVWSERGSSSRQKNSLSRAPVFRLNAAAARSWFSETARQETTSEPPPTSYFCVSMEWIEKRRSVGAVFVMVAPIWCVGALSGSVVLQISSKLVLSVASE